jgi:TetR/AcrR family transcriptional repressor of mexJK operon
LALRFYQAGPGRVKPVLAALISEAAAKGLLDVDNALLAAEDLFSLWEGGMRAEMGCGLSGPITPDLIEGRVRRGTAVFLRAYAVAG